MVQKLIFDTDIDSTKGLSIVDDILQLNVEDKTVGFDSTGKLHARVKHVVMVGEAIDTSTASVFSKTIAANTTFTFTNPLDSGLVTQFLLELTNGDAFDVTWPSNVTWPGGVVPTWTASGTDVIEFYTWDGGTNWRGQVVALDTKVVPPPLPAMEMVYDLSKGFSNGIDIPLYGVNGTNTGLNAVIDWGDGTPPQTVTTAGIIPHTYASTGTYTVRVTGSLPKYGSYNSKQALVSVNSFNPTTTDFTEAFLFAENLISVPTTLPVGVTNTSFMFHSASLFNGDISGWDTSAVTNMNSMFKQAYVFNRDLSTWTTGLTSQPTDFSTSANATWVAAKATKFPFLSDGVTRINT